MIHNNFEIWGADTLTEIRGGVCPQKVPEEVCNKLSSTAQSRTKKNIGMEIRFVPFGGEVKLTLSTQIEGESNRIILYHGAMQTGTIFTVTNEPQTFTVTLPSNLKTLERVKNDNGLAFSPKVVRLVMETAPVIIHSIEGDIRPPAKDEVPELNGIFYGSSITQGCFGIIPNLLWNKRTADKLGVDCRNFGFAGCCLVEHAMADYFASLDDWDFMVLELGINLVGKIELDEFRERVRYTLNTIHDKHPDKYMFCIDIFHYGCDNEDYHVKVDGFRQVVIEEAARIASPYIKIFGGETILTGDLGMSADMLHPSIEGIIEMADNLSRLMRPYIEKYKRFKK